MIWRTIFSWKGRALVDLNSDEPSGSTVSGFILATHPEISNLSICRKNIGVFQLGADRLR